MPQNQSARIIDLASYDFGQSSGFLDNLDYRGVKVHIEVAEVPANESVKLFIGGLNQITGDLIPIAESDPITQPGTYTLLVYPGIAPVPNKKVSDVIPAKFGVGVSHSFPPTTNTARYGVGIDYQL